MHLMRAVSRWFDQRLGVRDTLEPMITHPVPRTTASWWYVFGSATLALFVLQVVSGICLALVYVPAADQAYQSLEYLTYQAPFGWFLRAVHFWGSTGMVLVMTLHMIQVFLWGAYKYPRELTWIVGVFLFLCTLGMAFTGQILRWDQDAYWGLGIGASVAGRTPSIGPQAVELILGGPIIAGRTLSRFFALHVFVIPGVLIGLVGLHLGLVLRLGINEWPVPVAVLSVVLILLTVGTLVGLGTTARWSPVMDAWSALPTPEAYVKGRTPLELQGALVIQSKQCRNCHSLGGEGGQRGPALDGVGSRLTHDQLIRQVLQGGGNMPAYGKNLTPAEVTALVAFMQTLRPAQQPPARSSVLPITPGR
jgi:cytochrome c5